MTVLTNLVLGSTGKTGRRLVARLRAAGLPVRAASRSGEVHFDWHSESTWDGALSGAEAIYLVVPDEPVEIDSFIERATALGTHRIVLLSARGAELFGGAGMAIAERALTASTMDWTILRPNHFNQNFDEDFYRPSVLAGELALPIGEAPEPFVDAEDIADVAFAALIEDRHAGAIYELSGPAGLTFAAAIETIAAATGQPLRFVSIPAEDFIAGAVAQGAPAEAAEYLTLILGVIASGKIAEPADGVQRALGRSPRSFQDYATAAAGAGAWRS